MPVTCKLCGEQFGQINPRHLKKHNLTMAEYKSMFPNTPLRAPEAIQDTANGLRGRKLTPEHLANIIAGRKTLYDDPEYLAKLRRPRKPPKPKQLCLCGCEQLTNSGKKWIVGHNGRGVNGYKKYLECQRRIKSNEMIKCACGCGQLRPRYNCLGNELKYITGHYWQGKKKPESDLAKEHKRQAQLGRKRPEHSGQMTGKGNPNWCSGISYEPYGQEFNKELRKQILERDSYTCQVCSDLATIPHHINYIKKDNSPTNLIAVCRSCNAKANYNRGAWMVYFFLLLWIGRAR